MDHNKYNWFGLYRDPSDTRLIVPKRVPAMGWTLNLGHRHGPISLIATFVVVGLVVIAAAGLAIWR